MSVDLIQIFNDSFSVVSSEQPFFDDFYKIFIGKDKGIALRFKDTDMRKQKKMIKLSLIYMVNYHVQKKASEGIERLANLHDKDHLNVTPELYPIWTEALLEAVKLYDPYFDDNTDLAWRTILEPGIKYMISNFEK